MLTVGRGRTVDPKGSGVHKLTAALIGALALMITGGAAAGPQIGFAEDATKFADDGGLRLFDEMTAISTTTNRVAVFWDGTPNIVDQPFLDRMIPIAETMQMQIVFSIYPAKAVLAPTSQAAADAFCDYAVSVMQRYPYVRKVIIGNEPNQPRFWQPIWNGSEPASPAAMEVVLASCYDKLKAFDPTLDVIGVGLSPRGNDSPHATSNSSISPVRWIKALGDAYRASGRTTPLFDEWSWHCYPNLNTDEVETGYAWPNTGCVNAARVKLALWDAFHGTGQPTLPGYPVDTTGSTLYGDSARMFIDETGWQVDTNDEPGYLNSENVPTISEAKQADDYGKLVHLANCEPTLTAFHFFHEIDEADRAAFQSGVLRVDFSERESALSTPNSVLSAVEEDGGSCSGGVWQRLGRFLYPSSSVVRDYRTFPYRGALPLAARTPDASSLTLDAGEGFTYRIVFASDLDTAIVSGAAPRSRATVTIPPGLDRGVAIVVLNAEANPARTSTVLVGLGAPVRSGCLLCPFWHELG
jgi:hypothetical protein